MLRNGDILFFFNENEILKENALEYITVDSVLEDSEDERWLYEKNKRIKILPFTQLRISGRPLTLNEGSCIVLNEGSDLILD